MRLLELKDGSPDETAAMRGMFAARKEVFVDLLGWDVPVLDGCFEVDLFDDIHARYLILTDTVGRHRASARLLPTDRPHILGSLYPDLCAGAVPSGKSVLEITRFCLDRHQRAPARRTARNRLVTALVDHALATGITHYTGVAEIAWFEIVRSFGWECGALGQPRRHGSQNLVALQIVVDDRTVERMRRTGVYVEAQHDEVVCWPAVPA
jgi:acyl homoserine lactone synthase/acyl-homoserine lactone synthase